MTDDQIIHIAAINGWNVSTRMENGIRCFNFKRKTLGGVAFCFTAEMKNGKMENLISEIMSFVDAINPEVCAWEWHATCKPLRTWRTYVQRYGFLPATCQRQQVKVRLRIIG